APFESFTERTITEMEALRDHLARVAKEGCAVDREEYEHGVRCIGVPIRDYTQQVVAGISIAGPSSRLPDERIESELTNIMKEAGEELSHRLGYGIAVSFGDGDR
ncbi:IclR family transcriptional regulator C-terminal domain-containing protein, partial [Nitrospinae bacterium AH_259_B05_G02_I21]|nr:IclR family transcriptional regulator C-terminal domain-containing protein [Nitrospinae bacterium AH_259_B05_G02_I21]